MERSVSRAILRVFGMPVSDPWFAVLMDSLGEVLEGDRVDIYCQGLHC